MDCQDCVLIVQEDKNILMAKEWILNSVMNRFQLNFKRKRDRNISYRLHRMKFSCQKFSFFMVKKSHSLRLVHRTK